MIKLHDKYFEPYLSSSQISARVAELAAALDRDYSDKRPLFVAVLNGSFIFAADLFRILTIEAEICFVRLASYRGLKSTGPVATAIGLDIPIANRHVVVLEDVVDSGNTLNAFLPQLSSEKPASLKIASLLYKPESAIFPLDIDYMGFSIPSGFVVGYGMDYDGLGRNLPEIYRLSE